MSKTRVPAIPAPTDANLREVARAVKGLLDVREGLLGDPLDKSVTFRDLVDGGLAAPVVVGRGGATGAISLTPAPGLGAEEPDLTPPPAPTNLIASAGLAVIILEWDAPTYGNHAFTEIWRSADNVLGNAERVGTTPTAIYNDALGSTGQTRYYWVRHRSTADVAGPYNATNGVVATTGKIGNVDLGPLIVEASNLASGAVTATKLAAEAVSLTSFASGIEPVTVVQGSTVPTAKSTNTIFLAGTGKLYRWDGAAYTTAVPTVDLSGTIVESQIADGSVVAAKIADATLTTAKFASSIEPLTIVTGALPTTKSTSTIFRTDDSKTYRWNGSAYVASVPAADITGQVTDAQVAGLAASKVTGQLTNAQIADVAAAKLTGQIVESQIADAAISTAKFASGLEPITVVTGSTLPTTKSTNSVYLTGTGKLYRWIGAAYSAVVDTSDLNGTISNAQIAGVAASKVTGQLSDSQIADVAAAKLTGQVVASQIADAAVTTAKFASGIEPVTVVSSVPGTKSTNSVFNTADGKLYRWNGSAYVASVASSDISGTLAAAQIASLAASQITGQLSDSQIAEVAAAKLTGQVASSQIADLATSKLTGQITDAQIAGLAASKVSGQLADSQIAAVAAAKVTGQLTASQLNVAVGGANLIPNSGFEADTNNDGLADYWTDFTGGAGDSGRVQVTSRVTGAPGVLGSFAQRLSITSVTNSTDSGILISNISAVAGVKYTLSGYVRSNSATVAVRIRWYNASLVSITDDVTPAAPASQAWTRLQVTATAPPGAVRGDVMIRGITAPGEYFEVDGVQLEQSEIVTAYAPRPAEILPGTITTTEISDNAITTPKLVAEAVVAGKIAANAVTADKISANAVTAGKIEAGAVTTAKLAAGAVTADTIASNAVTSAKIEAGSVTAGKIAASSITASKLVVAPASIFPDPYVADAAFWALEEGWFIQQKDPQPSATGFLGVPTSLVYSPPATAGRRHAYTTSAKTPMQAGRSYLVRFKWRKTGNLSLRIGIHFQDTYGNTFDGAYSAVLSTNDVTTNGQFSFTAPAGTSFYQVIIFPEETTVIGSGWLAVSEFIVSERAAADLIVDGAVTAVKIEAGAVTTAKLAAGAVTADTIASNAVTAAKIEAGAITTAKLAAGAVTANEIAASTITGGKIAAGTITGSNIAADTITSGQIAAGAITASEIASGAITTNKLLVTGRGTALNDDPMFQDPSAWQLGSTTSFQSGTGADGAVANTYIGSSTDLNQQTFSAKQFPIGPGKRYRLSANVYAEAGNTRNMYLFVQFYDQNGSYVDYLATGWGGSMSGYTYGGTPPTGQWTRQGGQFGAGTGRPIPSNVRYAQIGVWFNYSGGPGTSQVYQACQDLRLEELVESDVIVDGAITASKVQAGAITTAKLAAGAVTANEIASDAVTAAKIEAGAITTAKLAAGAVTANEIAAATITGGKIAAGTITGSNIAADTITAGQIAAGAISASEVAAGAITVQKLLVAPVSLCPDPYFSDTAWWGATLFDANGWYFEAGVSYTNTPVQVALWSGHPTNAPGANRKHLWSGTVPAPAVGTNLRLRARMRNESNQPVYVTARFQDTSGTDLFDISLTSAAWSGLQNLTAQGAVPNNAATIRFIIFNEAGSTFSGSAAVSAVMLDVAASADLIVDGAVTAAKVQAGAITTAKLAAGAVTANEIAADAVTAAKIEAGAITTAKIAAGAIDASKIAANTITAAQIASGTITATQIASDTITAGQIAAGAIGASEIAANAITASKIVVANRDDIGPDPGFHDPVFWGWAGDNNFEAVTGSGSGQPRRFVRVYGGMSVARDYITPQIPVEAGASYRIRLRIWISSSATGWLSLTTHLPDVSWYSVVPTNGSVDSGTWPVIDLATTNIPKNTWNTYTGTITFQANSQGNFVQFRHRASIVNSYVEFAWEVVRASGADLIVDGAITANKIAAGSVETAKLAAGAVTANEISSGAITTAKLAANAVTANEIAADAITAGKIAAGAVSAAQIAAGAITTEKLLVASQGSLLPDGTFEDQANWGDTYGGTLASFKTVSDAPAGRFVAFAPSGSIGRHIAWRPGGSLLKAIPVDLTRRYRVSFYFRVVGSTSGANSYATVAQIDSAGNLLPANGGHYFYGWVIGATAPVGWTRVEFIFGSGSANELQAACRFVTPSFLFNWENAGGEVQIADVRIAQQAEASLIVDGAITANKIAANAIAVGTAAIQNGAIVNAMLGNAIIDTAKIADGAITTAKIGDAEITNAKIATLDAAKITTGTLDANRIAANSITASQINSNGLTIRDNSGNILFGVSNNLDFSRIGGATKPQDNATVGAVAGTNLRDSNGRNIGDAKFLGNLIDATTWVPDSYGSQVGFSENGTSSGGANYIAYDTLPDGRKGPIWRARSGSAVGSGPEGGWNGTPFYIDHTKMYRFSVWIRCFGANSSGSFYLGLNAGIPVGGSTIDYNPYFIGHGRSGIPDSQWVLVVGYVFPSGYTGAQENKGGVYRASDGVKILTCVDWKWISGAQQSVHRTYQFYTTQANNYQDFYDPRVELMDGSEPSLDALLAGGKAYAASLTSTWAGVSGSGKPADYANNTYVDGSGSIQGVSSGAGTAVSNSVIKVSRNIVRGLHLWQNNGSNSVVGEIRAADGRALRIPSTAAWVDSLSPQMNLAYSNDPYVVSFMAFVSSGTRTLYVDIFPDTLNESVVTVTTTPTLFKVYWTVSHPDAAACRMRFFAAAGADVYIYNAQIEYGAEYTPWKPNEADVQNTSISITGGAIQGIGTGAGTAVANSNISIGADGVLSGAGGGQVTLSGVGFTGDTDAQRNSRITVSGGVLSGIGTAGVQVDNSYQTFGQNLIPNSDFKQVITMTMGWNPNGATWFQTLAYASIVSGWEGNYILAGGTTRNVWIGQQGPTAGGDDAVAVDLYPTGGWSQDAAIPVVGGRRYCMSAYLQGHRCKGGVGVQLFDAAGNVIHSFESGPVSLPYGGAAALSQYQRVSAVGVAPANAASVRLFIRKYNTWAGESNSYFWVAAPQFEQVADNASGPSPYVSGPPLSVGQLGYTGDLDAERNSKITISGGAIQGIGSGAGTAVANANISIGSDGALSGAGGGQVTIGGLGYSGDLDAQRNSRITVSTTTGAISGIGSGDGQSVANNVNSRINAPDGGIFTTSSSSISGAVRVRLPARVNTDYPMVKFTVEIYEYISGYSTTLAIAGHTSGTGWYNVTAQLVAGNIEYPVYFGHDGTYFVVWIGAASETWSYPQVFVTNVLVGYTSVQASLWASNWNITFDTGGAINVTQSVLDTYPAADWSKTARRPANLSSLSGSEAIQNSQITISSGAIQGIGTGAGTAVANSNISLSSTGALSGAGGGQITTLPASDTRNTNELPSWSGYPMGLTEEFKTRSVIGAPGSATYGVLRTEKPWTDSSGGSVVQTFKSADGEWKRLSNSNWTAWGGWTPKLDRQIDSSNVSTYIASAAIGNAQIADASITNAKIGDASITTAKIGTGQITSALIADANITTAKIGASQITSALIADANIGTLKIAGNAVTIPLTYELSSTFSATGTVLTYNFTMPQGGKVIVLWQGQTDSARYFYFRIYLNTTPGSAVPASYQYVGYGNGDYEYDGEFGTYYLVGAGNGSYIYNPGTPAPPDIGNTRTGGAFEDAPTAIGFGTALAGANTVRIYWQRDQGTLTYQRLIILGAQR